MMSADGSTMTGFPFSWIVRLFPSSLISVVGWVAIIEVCPLPFTAREESNHTDPGMVASEGKKASGPASIRLPGLDNVFIASAKATKMAAIVKWRCQRKVRFDFAMLSPLLGIWIF